MEGALLAINCRIKKPVLFLIMLSLSHVSSLSQEKGTTTYERDTVSLFPPADPKLVSFTQNGIRIFASYAELLDIFKRVKKSQFRDGKRKFNTCIRYLKKSRKTQDSIDVTHLIESGQDQGQAYIFFCRSLNKGNVIVVDSLGVFQKSIIREKSTLHGGMLSSSGTSKYYLPQSEKFFLEVNDWRS